MHYGFVRQRARTHARHYLTFYKYDARTSPRARAVRYRGRRSLTNSARGSREVRPGRAAVGHFSCDN